MIAPTEKIWPGIASPGPTTVLVTLVMVLRRWLSIGFTRATHDAVVAGLRIDVEDMALCNETAKDQFLVRVLTAVGLLVEGDVSVGADDERDMGLHQSEPLPSGKVTVKLVTAIVSPAVMLVVFKIMSAELVPQVPCHSTVPPPFVEETRK